MKVFIYTIVLICNFFQIVNAQSEQKMFWALNSDCKVLTVDAPNVFSLRDSNTKYGKILGAGTINLNGFNFAFGCGNATGADFSGAIIGTGSINKIGTGTQTLSGDNTYTGNSTISGGTLIVGNGGTTGTLGSGTITNNSHIVFNRSDTAPIISQTIQGIGDVVQNGTGTLTFSGDNTYTGNTAVNAGRLNITGSVDTPNITVESGAILDLSLLKYSFGATGVVYNTVVEAGITYEISILPSLPSIIKLPNIINNGGTVIMPPDIEYYIVGGGGPGYSVSYGGGGGGGQVLQNTIALPLLKVDRTLIVGARGTTKNQNGFKSQLFSLIATPGFANSQAGNSSYARGGRANGVAGVVLEQRGANGIAPADASIKTALAGYFGIAETSVLLGAGGGGGSFFSGKRAGGVYGGGTGGKNGASTSAVLNTGAGGGGGGGTATAGGFGGSGLIVIKKIKY